MTRRLQRCRTCSPDRPAGQKFWIPRGWTRHRNRICATCRRVGPPGPTISYRGRAA